MYQLHLLATSPTKANNMTDTAVCKSKLHHTRDKPVHRKLKLALFELGVESSRLSVVPGWLQVHAHII